MGFECYSWWLSKFIKCYPLRKISNLAWWTSGPALGQVIAWGDGVRSKDTAERHCDQPSCKFGYRIPIVCYVFFPMSMAHNRPITGRDIGPVDTQWIHDGLPGWSGQILASHDLDNGADWRVPSGNFIHNYWSHGPVEIVDLPSYKMVDLSS